MTVIPAQFIRRLCTERSTPMIQPFHERQKAGGMTFGLSPAGYDVRIAETVTLQPGQFILASTLEAFHMPDNVIGFVHDKSTWARMGIAVQNTVIEPGWRGKSLTLEISNHGSAPAEILKGTPIAQIVFHRLEEQTMQPYNGRYQDQAAGPQGALLLDEAPGDPSLGVASAAGEELSQDEGCSRSGVPPRVDPVTGRITVTETVKFDEPTKTQIRTLDRSFSGSQRVHSAHTLVFKRLIALLVCMDAPRGIDEESMLSDMPLASEKEGYILEALSQLIRQGLELYDFPDVNYTTRADAEAAMYGLSQSSPST